MDGLGIYGFLQQTCSVLGRPAPVGTQSFNMLMTTKTAKHNLPLLVIFDLPPIGFCNEFLIGSKYADEVGLQE